MVATFYTNSNRSVSSVFESLRDLIHQADIQPLVNVCFSSILGVCSVANVELHVHLLSANSTCRIAIMAFCERAPSIWQVSKVNEWWR